MLPVPTVVTVLLLILAFVPVPAEAQIWDILAELSGPGPFTGRGNVSATIFCHGALPRNGGEGSGWFRLLSEPDKKGPCYFVDVRRFKSKEDTYFFPTRVEVYEAGTMYRLAPPVEIGFGLGVIHFDSGGGEIKANRMTLSFPNVVLKPFLLSTRLQNNGNWGFFQAYFRETRIVGELTAANFLPKPGAVFETRHDFVPSAGFIIDAVALLRLFTDR
jgi:hypothetical protein